jgi:hypothetical protein
MSETGSAIKELTNAGAFFAETGFCIAALLLARRTSVEHPDRGAHAATIPAPTSDHRC